jgi:hypothetical protein
MFDDLLETLDNHEHSLMRQKRMDEEAGYVNHTQPPDLSRLYERGEPHLTAGGEWIFRNDWDTAYGIQWDFEVLEGEGSGYEIVLFFLEQWGGTLEEERREATERLEQLKHLPPTRWCEVYEKIDEDEEEEDE